MQKQWMRPNRPHPPERRRLIGYGNDSRQNGPFGLRGSNSPLPEVISKIARAPPLVHDSAIYQQVRYQGEARFPNHSSADVIGSVTTSTFVDTNSARSRSLDLLRLRERLPSFSSSRPTVPSCHGTSTRMLTFSASCHSMRAGYRFGALEDVWVISDDSTFDSQECDLEEALTHIWGRGIGSILSCVPGKLAYFEGEEVTRLLER